QRIPQELKGVVTESLTCANAVSTRASELRKRFAKLRGRATGNSSERAIEIRHRLKAAGESSFTNSCVGIEQKRLRFLYSYYGEMLRKNTQKPQHRAIPARR